MKKIPTLWWVFFVELALFVLVVGGLLPRGFAWVLAALLLGYALRASLENAILLFVMSIPLFIALPFTSTFDNFNTWRIVSLVLAARFAVQAWPWPAPRIFRFREHPVAAGLFILGTLAALSLIGAPYPVVGIKRIIYFANLSLVPIVVYALVRQKRVATNQLLQSIAAATMVVIGAGFIQLASTYVLDMYQFIGVWGEQIQLRQFGTQWSQIAVQVGNTWFAYYGNQLSLRMFSLFPDSHSFPTFVLLGIPALLALSTRPVLRRAGDRGVNLLRVRAARSIMWVPAAFLAVILSGTRGMWVASIAVAALVPFVVWGMRRQGIDPIRQRIFRYVSSYLLVFFLLFALAWPVFISPQFLLGKADLNLFGNRLRSIIDFGETSNALRLAIWKASLVSIAQHPLLGVGIGNFPVVLGQDIRLARAGSTAHNLYLHVAAEMGIVAAVVVIALLANVWFAVWRWFRHSNDGEAAYTATLLLVVPWLYAYVMTDPIFFDERVFLMLGTVCACAWAMNGRTA